MSAEMAVEIDGELGESRPGATVGHNNVIELRRRPKAKVLYVAGQYGYEPFDPSLFSGINLGSIDFGRTWNEKGIDGFADALATYERGPDVTFDVSRSGLGHSILFGGAREARGPILFPAGQLRHRDGMAEAVCIVYAQTIKGKNVPVPVTWLGEGYQPELYFETNRADLRWWNVFDEARPVFNYHPHSAVARIAALFPPQNGGNSNTGSRL